MSESLSFGQKSGNWVLIRSPNGDWEIEGWYKSKADAVWSAQSWSDTQDRPKKSAGYGYELNNGKWLVIKKSDMEKAGFVK